MLHPRSSSKSVGSGLLEGAVAQGKQEREDTQADDDRRENEGLGQDP